MGIHLPCECQTLRQGFDDCDSTYSLLACFCAHSGPQKMSTPALLKRISSPVAHDSHASKRQRDENHSGRCVSLTSVFSSSWMTLTITLEIALLRQVLSTFLLGLASPSVMQDLVPTLQHRPFILINNHAFSLVPSLYPTHYDEKLTDLSSMGSNLLPMFRMCTFWNKDV